jgi:hypothetical protein
MPEPVPTGQPPVDVLAILASTQDQLDDLTAAVRAQQDTIDTLARAARSRDR